MEKLQYDSFYKFLISLGIILIATPILGLFSLIKASSQILITNEEIIQLSDISLQVLNKRNNALLSFYHWFPYIFIFLFILGLALFMYGAYKWKILQKEFDEQTFLTTQEKRFNFKKMTNAEIFEKVVEETEESQDNLNVWYDPILKAFQVENFCYHFICDTLPKKFHVQQNVKAVDTAFDIIASSKDIDILYEIKFFKTLPDFERFKKSIYKFENQCTKYASNTSKKIKAVFLVVVPNDNFDSICNHLKGYSKKIDLGNVQIQYLSEVEF